MRVKGLQRWIVIVVLAVSCAFCHAAENNEQLGYARSLLAGAGKDAQLRLVNNLDHREAFRVRTDNGKVVIEAAAGAGLIYGAQAVIRQEYESGKIEKPDFSIRGTTLCLMPGGYRATLSPKLYPWFYDKEFMTRTLDSFAAARLNTIFLWAGHMFPYIVEMPDYPEASSDIPPEQVKANQEQFRWFTSECEKRNIKVLLHFYNIHVSPPFAKAHKMRTNPTTPTPLLKEYTHYALSRYFKEFASVGLYACPGESIHSKYQLEWFRDVIFDAAKKSGKSPEIVIRDWTINTEFRDSLNELYDNVYSELKHNDESLTSPYPDLRHMQLEGVAAGHIVNFHLVTDLVPMRWGSPVMLQESMQHLKRLGFVKGVEFFGQMFWKWPYTLDKLEPSQKGYFPKGPKLVSLDRDAIYFKAFGRYLWRSDRDPRKEQEYWTQYLTKKFGSHKVGQLLYQWYVTSGSISPGLQNLNATKVAGWWPSVMLHNQSVDQILTYNKKLDETPYTLYRETGRAQQRFYPRPFDAFFFDRYRKTYSLPKPGSLPSMYKEFAPYKQRIGVNDLEQRHCMPVSQYAKALEEGSPVDRAMTPDKTATLLNTLAKESLELAGNAVQHANHSGLTDETRKELERFVTDSRMYVLATEALLHKEQAAILKARMLITSESKLAGQFLKHMEQSVVSYQKLAALTTTSYLHGNDLMKSHWKDSGLNEFQKDLTKQRAWLNGQPETAIVPPLPPEYFAKVDQYNVVWTTQSSNSGESMPVSGGDIGLNVWVENNGLMFYVGRAGYRDENGALLKPGRIRIKLTPNPFENGKFRQELKLRQGYVSVNGEFSDGTPLAIKVWVEVARPIVHLDIKADNPVTVEAAYESWRTETIELPNDKSKHDRRAMCMINYDAYPGKVFLYKDEIRAAEKIYAAYDAFGECAPRILRRFGITGGSRQCMSLGMFLDQLTDPRKYRIWQELYNSDSPPGETITQFIKNEIAGKPHVGETPPQIVKEVLAFAAEAVEQIEAAAPEVTRNKEEFERLRNDIHCIDAMTRSYSAKVNAAMMVHRYRHSKDTGYMKKALPLMEESLVYFKKLEELTRDTYRYANGLHGRQRVPKSGVYHWSRLVGDYEKELADFKKKVANIDKPQVAEGWRANRAGIKPWPAAQFKLLTKGVVTYEVKKGAKVFTDRNYTINDIAPQLVGLTGMRFSHSKAKKGGVIRIDFEVAEPVKVLVGYFDSTKKEFLQVPMLEHVAHADDRGGIDPVLEDVADIGDSKLKLPKVNVHAFRYDKGKQTLEMIGEGSYVILGVVPADAKLVN